MRPCGTGSRKGPSGSIGALAAVALALIGVAYADVLQYGDGTADGKKSFGGGGHLIVFDAGKDGRWLNRVELFGSRYGTAIAPEEDFDLWVLDEQRTVLRQVSLPYALWNRGEDSWRDLPIPPIPVPKQFRIGLTFNAHQTKGVYLGTDNVPQSHSFSWVPGAEGKPMEGVDWMVRATVEDAAQGDPTATDLVLLPDGKAFFDRVMGVAGDPLTVALAGHGKLPKTQVASIRFGAAKVPGKVSVTIVLANGMKIAGEGLTMTEKSVRFRDAAGTEREFPRADVVRIDFR